MDYQRIYEDIQKTKEACRELEKENFSFDSRLKKDLDALLSKAYEKQDELLRKSTEEIRGIENDWEEALIHEQKCLENNEESLEKAKQTLQELQTEQTTAKQLLEAEEAEQKKINIEVQEVREKAMSTIDMEKSFPNQRRLQSLLYKGTRVTWGKSKKSKENGEIIRGFVCNHTGTDVQTFELDKTNLSKKDVHDFIWDYIGAGIANEWKKVGQS